MITVCEDCKMRYDDARSFTNCPHVAFLSVTEGKRKDAAISLLGRQVRFNHQAEDDAVYLVNSVGRYGMVTLDKLSGEFAPHLFKLVNEE